MPKKPNVMSIIFPVCIMCMQMGAAIAYAARGDWRRALYWAAATVLTIAVTF